MFSLCHLLHLKQGLLVSVSLLNFWLLLMLQILSFLLLHPVMLTLKRKVAPQMIFFFYLCAPKDECEPENPRAELHKLTLFKYFASFDALQKKKQEITNFAQVLSYLWSF